MLILRLKPWNKAIRITLAILLLFPFCGVFINIHKCNGHIVSLGINENAVKCSMNEQNSCSNHHEVKSKPCCETISIYNNFKLAKQELDILVTPVNWISLPMSSLSFCKQVDYFSAGYSRIKSSPPILSSRPSLQVFRI